MGRHEGTESFLGRGGHDEPPHRHAFVAAEPEYVFGAAETLHSAVI